MIVLLKLLLLAGYICIGFMVMLAVKSGEQDSIKLKMWVHVLLFIVFPLQFLIVNIFHGGILGIEWFWDNYKKYFIK